MAATSRLCLDTTFPICHKIPTSKVLSIVPGLCVSISRAFNRQNCVFLSTHYFTLEVGQRISRAHVLPLYKIAAVFARKFSRSFPCRVVAVQRSRSDNWSRDTQTTSHTQSPSICAHYFTGNNNIGHSIIAVKHCSARN